MTKHEPYKIKSIRHIKFTSLTDRKKLLRDVNYNTGLLSSDDVTFDMVTQGSSAASQEQKAPPSLIPSSSIWPFLSSL